MTTLEYLRRTIPIEVFEDDDLHLVLNELSIVARYSCIGRLLKSKAILKIRRGLYIFGEKSQKENLSKYVVATRLYSPSYVSFESALSFHGLIPESVQTTTSACVQNKKKNYSTPLGNFSYHHIPVTSFRYGVENINTKGGTFLMANAIKALFDLVYARKKEYKNLKEIEDDLRIDYFDILNNIKKHSYHELKTVALSYKKKNCEKLFNILIRETKA